MVLAFVACRVQRAFAFGELPDPDPDPVHPSIRSGSHRTDAPVHLQLPHNHDRRGATTIAVLAEGLAGELDHALVARTPPPSASCQCARCDRPSDQFELFVEVPLAREQEVIATHLFSIDDELRLSAARATYILRRVLNPGARVLKLSFAPGIMLLCAGKSQV